uniref:Uncharacterized protein n=1 Tax=Desulfobacca acetoxidans TaxID=60893 RepID=A0A7V4LDG1_9BACT
MDFGPWTLDLGLWTLDLGLWSLDCGPWTVDFSEQLCAIMTPEPDARTLSLFYRRQPGLINVFSLHDQGALP